MGRENGSKNARSLDQIYAALMWLARNHGLGGNLKHFSFVKSVSVRRCCACLNGQYYSLIGSLIYCDYLKAKANLDLEAEHFAFLYNLKFH